MLGLCEGLIVALVAFLAGVLAMYPYKQLAMRQAEWIMAERSQSAYASIDQSGRAAYPAQSDLPERARDAAQSLYMQAIMSGQVSDSEITKLREAGAIKDGVIQ